MPNKTYIHFGHDSFDKSCFQKVFNRNYFNKPAGGFWGSPVETELGWKDFVESNWSDIAESLNKSFCFQLTPQAKVLEIHSVESAREVAKKFPNVLVLQECAASISMLRNLNPELYVPPIDFEAISREYDALEFFLTDDFGLGSAAALDGWDCDSLVVFNPDVVMQLPVGSQGALPVAI